MAPQPPAAAAARKKYLYLRKNHKLVAKLRDPKDKKKKKAAASNSSLKITELPGDLLVGEILSGLHPADRMRFSATCKKNHSLIKNQSVGGRREIDELPWLATLSPGNCGSFFCWWLECRLYEPTHRPGQPPYASYEITCPEEEGFNTRWNQVIASKLGWVLSCWPKEQGFNTFWNDNSTSSRTETTSFLLFSPFSRRFIKLPDLKDSIHHVRPGTHRTQNLVATFSSCPSSSIDCIYFVLIQNVIPGKVTISTLKQQQQKEWKSVVFDELGGRWIDSVAYLDGLFYCVSRGGHLAAYDPFQETLTIVVRGTTQLLSSCLYILEFRGNLLLVCHDAPRYHTNGLIQELDSSTKTWVQKTSLEDGAIFLPCFKGTSFSVSTTPSSDVANKIYFYGRAPGGHCIHPKHYSLKDGQSYLCHDGSNPSTYWSSDTIPQGGMWIQQSLPLPALSPS